MFISDTDKKSYSKTICVYLSLVALCMIINAAYSKFSHGVSSKYMTYMFLFPLLCGALLFLILRLFKLPFINRAAFNAYNSSLAAFTVGNMLHGVFEIAGTSSKFQVIYTISGIVFALTGIFLYIIFLKKQHSESPKAT